MSDPDFTPPPQPVAPPAPRKNLYRRLTGSVPALVSIGLHAVFILIAAAIVVQTQIVEKKRTFEAAERVESAAERQVEHRLQVARRGGASGASSSPVSANRIFSTDANALQMPSMPDLPSMGAGGFGGFGGMGSGVGLGAGTGMATSLGGGTGLGGRGFMSLNFLGATSQNASKIVFVVDTSTSIMEPAKGGFRAFTIIREEIMRLVGRLPPSAQFNVVLYSGTSGDDNGVEINLFKRELVPATSDNKKAFFDWMTPVNSQLGNFGPYSALTRTAWRRKPLPTDSGIDPLHIPPVWSRAVQAALEQQPDTVYLITASQGNVRRRIDDATYAKRMQEADEKRAEFTKVLESEGLTYASYFAARDRALAKAGQELAAANRRLVAAGKDPIIVSGNWRIFESSVQSELRRNGITIELDRTGWSRKNGSRLDPPGGLSVTGVENSTWNDFNAYFARLQNVLLPERANLNIFLFVGPNDRAEDASRNLTTVARRNGGTFQLLTTKRLEEIKARAEAEAAR